MPRPTKCAVSETARTHSTAPIRGYLPVFGNALQMADCVVADAVTIEPVSPANLRNAGYFLTQMQGWNHRSHGIGFAISII